jgi:lipopolysaccharide/colanic/teichoic acid biosynthesis glycosyltransferase
MKYLVKRIFDILLSFTALVLISPALLLLIIIIGIKLGRPIIFRQKRPGKMGKIFEMYKFRTMTEECNKDGQLLSDKMRLTKFGKFLRKTSIDEIPELWNILRGEMSFVGPRPLLASYMNRYTEEQSRRHNVKPGLTGWAQVNGRNSISWEEKFKLDIWYVDNWTIQLDIKILFMTIEKVLKGDGISSGTSETMEEFYGTDK